MEHEMLMSYFQNSIKLTLERKDEPGEKGCGFSKEWTRAAHGWRETRPGMNQMRLFKTCPVGPVLPAPAHLVLRIWHQFLSFYKLKSLYSDCEPHSCVTPPVSVANTLPHKNWRPAFLVLETVNFVPVAQTPMLTGERCDDIFQLYTNW